MTEPSRTFRAAWRSAPRRVQAFALFLLGLFLFEIALALWKRYPWFELPSLRYTLEMGYLMCLPLTYYVIRYRRRRLYLGIVTTLAIQAIYAASLLFLLAETAGNTIAWTIGSSVFWLAMMILVSRFESSRGESVA